ncbi:MAG TPA: hypothetical protein VN512_13275 [Clostridia bacterium]|nr:hypothetical protein [Clostridia bacterium]
MKKLIAATLTLFVCISLSAPALAVGNGTELPQSGNIPVAKCDALVTFISDLEFTILSTRAEDADKVELSGIRWVNGPNEKEVTAVFRQKIYDASGALMATIPSTVKGVCSLLDGRSRILNVTAAVFGPYAQRFSHAASISGSYGYLNLYASGILTGTMTYSISPGGTIIKGAS